MVQRFRAEDSGSCRLKLAHRKRQGVHLPVISRQSDVRQASKLRGPGAQMGSPLCPEDRKQPGTTGMSLSCHITNPLSREGLRRGARACQQWMDDGSVLPDDEGPEASPELMIVQHDDRAISHRQRCERTERSATTSASHGQFRIPEPMRLEITGIWPSGLRAMNSGALFAPVCTEN